jgi:hypothetical protein
MNICMCDTQLKAALAQMEAEAVAVERVEAKEWESLRALRDFSTDSKCSTVLHSFVIIYILYIYICNTIIYIYILSIYLYTIYISI